MAQHHDDLYDLALNDPEFLEAVRSHHAGSWDVLDALWWASHPLDTSPGGLLAPLARVRALQHRVFAADADAAGDHRVHEDLRRLEAEIIRETGAIDAAVIAAQTGVGAALAGADNRAGPGDTAEPDAVGEADDWPAADAPRPAAARRRLLLIGGLIAAVLVGVIVGGQFSAGTMPGGAPAPTPSPTAASTSPPLALSAFQREQTPEDLPAIPLPEVFDPPTLRQLGSMGSVEAGSVPQLVYYVARTTSNMVCLIVVPQTLDYLSTCTLEQEFPATGLRLYWRAEGIFSSPVDGSLTGPLNTYLTWRPDGSVEVGSEAAAG
ncbi:hypothetical protein C3B61_00105 [Cryobacterium zongtaii]|uniref:Uncharacterized protein n=1 Tax=Cryobacterium zongtaii TaxID=1259217 RepID=A0A2S3ZMR6_9MICO|nr:hypothetical protein [Cryobacterium zongtaii]POH70066.1 hypothetical protein C3B61_00105 [Cryobacterium zongtaii]